MTLDELNRLPTSEAWIQLERCCGASAWLEQMCAARPFRDPAHLVHAAERAADALSPRDWIEAFAHHPRIGDVESLRRKFAATAAWAGAEQSGAAAAAPATLEALARRNQEYELRFGHLFIVCATGKSADEMLALLEERLDHDPAAELRIAAEEQRKITRLRLEKLLGEDARIDATREGPR